MKGRLLVLEGADASGKATQAKLLLKHLRKEGKKAELLSFPRYGSFFGKLIKKHLQGKAGKSSPVDIALLYALDRYDAKQLLQKKLRQGKIVIADRYRASNIAYQAAHLQAAKQRQFTSWIKGIESGLPEPSLTVYLDVPPAISQKLMRREGRKRDLYEKNTAYLKRVRKMYLNLSKQGGWAKISCVKNGKLLPIEEVHELVWKQAKRYL